MTCKTDAEHIEDFTFIPVGSGPDVDNALHLRVVGVKSGFDADIGVPVKRKQVVDQDEREFEFAAIGVDVRMSWPSDRRASETVYRSWFSGAGGDLSPGLSEQEGKDFVLWLYEVEILLAEGFVEVI